MAGHPRSVPAEPMGDTGMQAIEEFLTTWAAAEQAGDTTTLETELASDFTAAGPLGFTLTKQAWLARHRHGDLTYQAFSLSEVTTRTAGGTAIVTARTDTRGSYQGHPIPEAVRATLILVRDAGSWRLAAIHMSFIAGTAGAPPIPGASGRAAGEKSAA
jgi:ketosteroid isomerase-like protein